MLKSFQENQALSSPLLPSSDFSNTKAIKRVERTDLAHPQEGDSQTYFQYWTAIDI